MEQTIGTKGGRGWEIDHGRNSGGRREGKCSPLCQTAQAPVNSNKLSLNMETSGSSS